LIGWWWAAFLVLNLTLNAYSLQGGDGYDLAEVKAFNAIAGIGEVIGLLVSLAAGTLWAAIVLRIERNQAALLTEIFPPHAPARTRTHTHTHTHDGTRDGWLRSGEVDNFHPALARVQVPSDKGVRNSLHVKSWVES
jgi:hypothetical protein